MKELISANALGGAVPSAFLSQPGESWEFQGGGLRPDQGSTYFLSPVVCSATSFVLFLYHVSSSLPRNGSGGLEGPDVWRTLGKERKLCTGEIVCVWVCGCVSFDSVIELRP